MMVAHGTVVAVIDGEKLELFRNTGNETRVELAALPGQPIAGDNKSGGVRHHSSDANPDDSRLEEDSFAAASAAFLNKEALANRFDHIVVIAAPKTLGELRKHYHKALSAKLLGELSKELTGRPAAEIAAAVQAA